MIERAFWMRVEVSVCESMSASHFFMDGHSRELGSNLPPLLGANVHQVNNANNLARVIWRINQLL